MGCASSTETPAITAPQKATPECAAAPEIRLSTKSAQVVVAGLTPYERASLSRGASLSAMLTSPTSGALDAMFGTKDATVRNAAHTWLRVHCCE